MCVVSYMSLQHRESIINIPTYFIQESIALQSLRHDIHEVIEWPHLQGQKRLPILCFKGATAISHCDGVISPRTQFSSTHMQTPKISKKEIVLNKCYQAAIRNTYIPD